MVSFREGNSTIDTEKVLWGFRANDIVVQVSFQQGRSKIAKFLVKGVEGTENLWLENMTTKKMVTPVSAEGLILFERPDLLYKISDGVTPQRGKAKHLNGIVRAINPYTNALLVEFATFKDGQEISNKDKKKPWFPKQFKYDGKRYVWCELSVFTPEAKQKLKVNESPAKEFAVEGTHEFTPMADWLTELDEKRRAKFGHVFALWGNVADLQQNQKGVYLTLQQYLEEIFSQCKLIMYYCLSAGLQFADEEMEDTFRDLYMPKSEAQPPPESHGGRSRRSGSGGEQKLADAFNTSRQNTPLQDLIGTMPEKVFPLLEKALIGDSKRERKERKPSPKVLVINFADNVFPYNASQGQGRGDRIVSETLQRWAMDHRVRDSGTLVFLITPQLSRLDPAIREGHTEIVPIRVAKPTQEQRADRWGFLTTKTAVEMEEGLAPAMLSRATNGLSLRQIDEVYRLSVVRRQGISLASIRKRKRALLQNEFGGRINVLNPEYGYDHFGGRPELIEYLQKLQYYMLNGIYRRVPVGILSPGPPGTGKTTCWMCFAHETGLNCLSIGTLRSMWQGISEQNTDEILGIIDDMSPVVVIEDEADQSEGSRDSASGDAGVSNRMRKKKFEFCSDPRRRGRVIWVRLTNRQDLLDSAYRRKGRTDEVIPFVLPTVEDMAQIFAVKFNEYDIPTQLSDFTRFAKAAKDRLYITGADIDWMVREADLIAEDNGKEIVEAKHLIQAVADWEMQTDPIDMDRQTVMALRCSSKRFRPTGWEQTLSEAEERLGISRKSAVYPGSGSQSNSTPVPSDPTMN
ncbi:ATP-binding protein [Candidatus Falkowbacteria bacterium]|nr:ATP-binding protein [Candidatus Falkowbacteria bacterium]